MTADTDSTHPHVTGLVPAPHTPMHADGSVNLDTIEKQAELLVANGVAGVFVCGTTGEGMSLTVQERLDIAARWQAVAGEQLRVIVHVGHLCLPDSQTLAAHAQKIGAFGIGTIAPCFFRPETVEELVEYCAEVASAAPELPAYYYHIPSLSGASFAMMDFLKIAAERIPSLGGIKYTWEDLMDFGRCVRFDGGRFNILFGRDEILLSALSLGAKGAVGSTYNYAAPLYHGIIEAYEAGDLASAQAGQARAMDMVDVLHRFRGLACGKAVMSMIGVDCGGVRSPLRNLSSEEYATIRSELEGIGFFEYCSKL
ncbi:MAG: dihydrodipicolinate synthase family protein [Armatimonadota bacterium]